MATQVLWIKDGRPLPSGTYQGSALTKDECADMSAGAMRVVYGGLGTELRWTVESPCLASIFAAAELVSSWVPPFVLRYRFGGWTEERYASPDLTRGRLLDLVADFDRPLHRTVLLKPSPVPSMAVAPMLAAVHRSGIGPRDASVVCSYDPQEDTFVVQHIGPKSMIGQVFGTDRTSYPCLTWGPYGRAISGSYVQAVDQKAIIYEHVLALLPLPDHVHRWVPYHRLIVPETEESGRSLIRIYSEMAPVEIKVF